MFNLSFSISLFGNWHYAFPRYGYLTVFSEREFTSSRSLYAIARPSAVRLSSVCRL